MTSSYSKKITKVKNALENVFVKKTDIKNNLTSTDINKPLSANQGKILDTNKVDKISGKSLSTNDFTNTYKTKLDNLDTLLENKANNIHTHGNLQNDGSIGISNNINKNVVTDGNGKITTEDKPTIPSASSTVPSADTSSGSYGSGTTYARANHQHPKSSLYAETSHTHDTATLETDGFLSMQDKAKLDNLSYDSGWQEVTFKSGYTKYKDSMSVYIRRKGNFVELTGVWKPTSTKSAATNPVAFASIPDELKPTKSINVICPGIGKYTYRLTVETNGELKWAQYGTNTSIDLKDSYFAHVHCTWTI